MLCHQLSSAANVNLFIKRCGLCTLFWKQRAFKRHDYRFCSSQIHWVHSKFSIPGRRHLFTHQSHVCFLAIVCWQPQTHPLLDSKAKSPLPELSCTLYAYNGSRLTRQSKILFQTPVILENPFKPRTRKQWLFLKRPNLLNSILTDVKTKSVYSRPHGTWT